MKGLKLRKLLSVAAVMSMLTVSISCGKDSGESNYGFSSGEKAFEFFADAATECDGKKMIKCIPPEVKNSLENEYSLTESQLCEKINDELYLRHCTVNYAGEKFENWDNENVPFEINVMQKEELEADDVQEMSNEITANGGKISEKGYYIYYSVDNVENEFQDDQVIDALGYYRANNRNVAASQVYEQDGKWYSYEALLVAISAACD